MTLTAPGSVQADSSAGGPIPPSPAKGLICRNCGAVSELEDSGIATAVAQAAAGSGFRPAQATVEIEGICAACAAP